MNILYIDAGNVVRDSHMYQYYGDLFRELEQLANVTLYQGPVTNIIEVVANVNPSVAFDCVIFGLGYFAQNNPEAWLAIDAMSDLKMPSVCLLHKPQSMLAQKLKFCELNNIKLIVDSQSTFKDCELKTGIKSIRLPFTATPKLFYPRDVDKKYDIGFSGALHGGDKIKGPTRDLRARVKNLINPAYQIFWNGSDSVTPRIRSLEEYAKKINECKVWLSTTGPMLDVGPRYFEVMLSKTLLICNKMPEQYEDIFIDEVNCIMFENDLSDFEEKLDYYINCPEERNRIVESAYKMISENYTWKHMAEKLLKAIKEIS